jgi:hypothetical protein
VLVGEVLFRDIDPRDKKYELGSLIEDVFSLLNMKVDNKEKLFKQACDVFDLKEGLHRDDQEARLRNTFYEHFISSRSMALNAMKEGLSLNGKL